MNYLSVHDIIKIHREIVMTTGGVAGVLQRGNLDFVVALVRGDFRSGEDIFTKAAYLLKGIIQGHPFVDGNKRTGFEATDIFLRKNGYYLDVDVVDGVSFTIAVAMNALTDVEIRGWIKHHSKKIN